MRNQPPEFANVVLDSLTAHIAVLDSNGVVIGVNEPWRRFAEENHGETHNYYVGRNYLSVCENSARCGGDETARALIEGLRKVLCNEQDSFVLEYPCHSPEEERWFIARVTRCSQRGESRVVVSHDDITTRKKAELALERADRELQQLLKREQAASRTDELTGLYNRRHFFGVADQLFTIANRYGQPLSVALFDVDHFKRINDRHGHQTGDQALRLIANCAASHVRSADILARYGGEEFILLMPETGVQQAVKAADAIRADVANLVLECNRGQLPMTISAGIAQMMPSGDTLEALIRRADEALYKAKASGRNRCLIFHSSPLARIG